MPRLRYAVPLLLGLLTGLSFGTLVRQMVLYESPVPGTEEDKKMLADLQQRIDKEFKVQIFRGKCVSAGRAIRGGQDSKPGWVELDTGYLPADDSRLGTVRAAELQFEKEKHANREKVQEAERAIVARGGAGDDAAPEVGHTTTERMEALKQQAEALGLELNPAEYGQTDSGLDSRFADGLNPMTRGALGGSRGLAVERVFWNARESELVAVVWLGDALCGWPKVVHGGLLATTIGEKAGMAAALLRDELVGGARIDVKNWRDLESMDVQYKKPTYAGAFHVIRAVPRVVTESGRRSIEVDSVLETMEGQVSVKVIGKVPVSATANLGAVDTSASWWRSWRLW
ncbi:hypothetical protein K461DRAFT_290646 [Myriangium duriaei CBS 260.36]|uniref:Thioesterase domain-containing protein n=1 Tax=Myriangium duriaei CBS 260.36 TaxID=1168546 RepID=A0A9P4MJS9_9PEZI|nr:hypothetical protein K461DRAFT_290646 [Myriangium duriaei CBS 260.36]